MASSWFSLYSTIKMMHGPINIRFTIEIFSCCCSAVLDSQFYEARSFFHIFWDSGRPVLTFVATAWRVAPGWLLHKWKHWCCTDEGNGLQIRKVAWNVFNKQSQIRQGVALQRGGKAVGPQPHNPYRTAQSFHMAYVLCIWTFEFS